MGYDQCYDTPDSRKKKTMDTRYLDDLTAGDRFVSGGFTFTEASIIDFAFRGKKVFVNLWATWCPPCRAEIPSIESLGAKTDKNKVEFVLLSLDENYEKAKSYAPRNGIRLPVYYPAGSLPPLFNVEGIPVTYIFIEKGDVIYQQDIGSANYDTKEFLNMLNK